jgi:Lrp/AsnC family transcriptional regulator, leucine-responsive regulatory protein
MTKNATNLDALDRRLLRALQERCTLTAEELADRCGTSQSTALRRLNRLRSTGVIANEVAVVDGASVGRPLTVIVSLRLEREDGRAVEAFIKRVAGHDAVQQFYFVTGTTDYVVILNLSSMEEYDEFLQQNLVSDPIVVMSDTNVVIRPLKRTLAVPIA